jgi:hypothetical protein
MTQTHQPEGLSLPELFRRYLERQVTAQEAGLGFPEAEGEVVPHEAVPVQPVDPQQAWQDAVGVVSAFLPPGGASAWQVPPEWPTLVAAQEPAVALAFCLGNFPQMVRNLHPLLAGGDPAALRQGSVRPLPAPALLEWTGAQAAWPQVLLAAGVLRLARHFDEASDLLRRAGEAPAEWRPMRANEEAALLWHRGRTEEALAQWQAQPDSVPVLFNRGMASLFLGQSAAARAALSVVVEQLPDTSAWHHLGHLYLALAARS